MNDRQLQSFVILAEELHFGKAALRLNIAQPALSQHIKALEQTLDIPLFTRDKRNVALTFEGQQLLEDARAALAHGKKLRENAHSLKLGFKGQLKIGYVGSSILDPALMRLMRDYRQTTPAIDIVLEEHSVHEQLRRLLNQQLDIAFVRSPVPQHDELEYLDIITRPLIAVLPHHHPLSTENTISLSALSDAPFLIQQDPPGIGLGGSVLYACKQAGFVPQHIQFTRDVSIAIGLVSLGMGVTLVPETQRSVIISDVKYCHLRETCTTTLTLIWQKHVKNKVAHHFTRYASSTLGKQRVTTRQAQVLR